MCNYYYYKKGLIKRNRPKLKSRQRDKDVNGNKAGEVSDTVMFSWLMMTRLDPRRSCF